MGWEQIKSFFNKDNSPDLMGRFNKAEKLLDQKKYSQASKIYIELSNLNHPRSMIRLSQLYSDGNGVEKNYGKAISLLQIASEHLEDTNSAQVAFILLGSMYEHGHGCIQSELNAHICYSIAEELGMDVPTLLAKNAKLRSKLQSKNDDLANWICEQIKLSYAGFLILILELKRNESGREDTEDMKIYDSIKSEIFSIINSNKKNIKRSCSGNVEKFLAEICFIKRTFIQDAAVLQVILLLNEALDYNYARKLLDVISSVWIRALAEYMCPQLSE